MAPRMASYRPHSRKNEHTAPNRPRMNPSTTNGRRIKPFVAPDHAHDGDLLAAVEHGKLDRIGNDDERHDEQHGRDAGRNNGQHVADRGHGVGDRRIGIDGRNAGHLLQRVDGLLQLGVVLQRDDVLVAHGLGGHAVVHDGVIFLDERLQSLLAGDEAGIRDIVDQIDTGADALGLASV